MEHKFAFKVSLRFRSLRLRFEILNCIKCEFKCEFKFKSKILHVFQYGLKLSSLNQEYRTYSSMHSKLWILFADGLGDFLHACTPLLHTFRLCSAAVFLEL